jgi:hypothetical protein
MLEPGPQPRVVTTLHGTDTTLLGRDAGYGPAIHHALSRSDAVTAVSAYLQAETQRVLGFNGPIDVIHNFFSPRPPHIISFVTSTAKSHGGLSHLHTGKESIRVHY